MTGAIPLRCFQKMACAFRGRGSTLETSIVILCGTCTALDMSWYVACFLRIALSGLCQLVTMCQFRGSRGILGHVMKTDGNFARNIDFEVANFEVHEENS